MKNQNKFNVVEFKRKPWNKGKVIGQKQSLHPEHVRAIRTRLQNNGRIRDLALFNLAIDSKLLGRDVVSLKVEDIAPQGTAIEFPTVRRKNRRNPVKFVMTMHTRQSVDDYMRTTAKVPGEYLFNGRRGSDRCLTTRQYARLVSQWIESIGLDSSMYGTHSLRRTTAPNQQSAEDTLNTPDKIPGTNYIRSNKEAAAENKTNTNLKASNAKAVNYSVKMPVLKDVANTDKNRQKGEKAFSVRPRLITSLFVISILVLVGGGWAATARLSGAIIAQGFVVVESHVNMVQHFDGGIVAEINVKNGDVVQADEILIRLDDTRDRAGFAVVQSQIIELTGRMARLTAERDGQTAIEFSPEFDAMGPDTRRVRIGEVRLFESNRVSNESAKNQLLLRIGQQKEEIRALTSQRDAKENELKLIRKELGQVRKLFKQKLISVTRLYSLEREATRIDGERGGLEAQIARVLSQISEINLQILAIDQSTRRDAQREIREIEANLAELTERKVAVADRLSRVELRAPISGVVHELKIHTVGGVVTPAEPVMLIVPVSDDLTIEARILPNDIDQVATDQPVRIRLSAFNQRATSELHGRVVQVAADVTQDDRSGQNYYMTRIQIGKASLEEISDWKLVPGMPVEIFITTGERTALSYLAKPITDQLARAFRDE